MPSWSLAYSEFHLIVFIFTEMLIEIDGNYSLLGPIPRRVRGRGFGATPTYIPFIGSENQHVNTQFNFA
jgi:hypothetical protein